ncbi:MAG TPA: dTMP kinase [Verrucomicrobiales bacterium]|nr:dTMP kinase [Verrucomicrobiales bacterium]
MSLPSTPPVRPHGCFITFEGTEGGGKSTQIRLLAERLQRLGRAVLQVREPGGTPLGEEIRHTLKHSPAGQSMTPEAELLLMNASRAQLVRETIRPALARGEVVVCDRFFDSSLAYQGYGRGLPLEAVRGVIDFAVGETRPNLTLLLWVPLEVSEARRRSREASSPGGVGVRDRFEESDRGFFQRVEQGYQAIEAATPGRIRRIDATQSIEQVQADVWEAVSRLL